MPNARLTLSARQKLTIEERDPSPCTSLGVMHGIAAAVQFKLKRHDLNGIHVAIQGTGHVGYHLAQLLHERGARLTVSDVNETSVRICAEKFQASIVPPGTIYEVNCDVFAPCAMGGILNANTIPLIQASIIAGSANNQLAHRLYGQVLHNKGILYAPDFVINAGGLISAAIDYTYRDPAMADLKIAKMYDSMLHLYERSAQENVPTTQMAERIALEKLENTHTGA